MSVMMALLAAEHDLPSPSLSSLLKSEHKGWSRLEQRASVPECVPGFALFDPFDDDALAGIDLRYPFWVKPIKGHSSAVGFKVEDAAGFADAIAEVREHIAEIGDPFNAVLHCEARRSHRPPHSDRFVGAAGALDHRRRASPGPSAPRPPLDR